MEELFEEQAERDAMDNDSNYSAESFKRKQQMEKEVETKSKRLSSIRMDLTSRQGDDIELDSIKEDGGEATPGGVNKSHLSGKLSTKTGERSSGQLIPVPSEKSFKIAGNLKKKPKFMNDPLK